MKYTRITLRIPEPLHEKLTDSANNTSKSMNADIISRINDSFSEQDKSFIEDDVLLSVEDAIKQQQKARSDLARVLIREVMTKIKERTSLGYGDVYISLRRYELMVDDSKFDNVINPALQVYKDIGYQIKDMDHNGFTISWSDK